MPKRKDDAAARWEAGLAALPQPEATAATAPARPPPRPARDPGVAVNVRMPAELRDWYVRHAAKITAERGRPTSAQRVMLDVLDRHRRGLEG